MKFVLWLVVNALVFGVINAVVAPVVKLLSLPFIILTLGPVATWVLEAVIPDKD